MADTEKDQITEPWDGYNDTSADELIEAAGRKRSAEKIQEAIDYEKAHKNRVTVIDAFTERLGEVDADANATSGDDETHEEPAADVEPTKGQPGEIRDGDTTTPGSAQDTAGRQTTGQVAAREDQERIERDRETNEKAEKAARDGGVTPRPVNAAAPVYAAENRQDRYELAGHEYRVSDDVEPDPGYQFDAVKAMEADLVDHFAVASTAGGLFLEIDGKFYRFDRQMGTALGRIVQSGQVAIHN